MAWIQPLAMFISGVVALKTAADQYEAGRDMDALAKESERIAEKNALREEAENAERNRRLSSQKAKEEGMARAAAAGSGFAWSPDDTAGSIALSLLEQKEENAKQLAWEKAAGKSRADIIRQQGRYSRRQGEIEADTMRSKAFSTAGEGVVKLGGAAYEWWGKGATK